MQQESRHARNPSSPILPFVVAAFAGATLAIACERPDSRASAEAPAARGHVASQQPPPATRSEVTQIEAPASRVLAGDAISDTMISGHIKAALLTDPGMAGSDISVNTDHGVVTLTGTVKSHEQTGIASGHAQRQDGVMRVDSHLSVAPQ